MPKVSRNSVVDPTRLPAMLTVAEAASLMRVGLYRAYDLVYQGQIPAVRLGRRIRIPRDPLLEKLGLRRG